ncbi:MAG: translation initiation factor IF-2 [Nitrospirae bacterium]|nr:translation initiation factor IF-2 [Nitrospirota bacterium]
MNKIRIYELAKKLHVASKEIISELAKLGVEAKSHSSGIEDNAAKKLTGIFTKKTQAAAAPAAKTKEKAPKHLPKKEKEAKPAEVKKEQLPEKIQQKVKSPLKKAAPVKEAEEKIVEEPTSSVASTPNAEPESPVAVEEEEDIKVPDRFRKAVEVERFTKFKGKPGMQKAFDTIKRVDFVKKFHELGTAYKKTDKKMQPQTAETKGVILPTQPRKRVLKFQEGTTVKEFAELIGQKLAEVIKKFMELGYMPTINQPVDLDAAQILAEAFGLKIETVHIEDEEAILEEEVDASRLKPRSPIVTIMGHVDHGKTSLLDAIRQTKITEMEAGGITQHIGAYKVKLKDREIVFLDTPGHEAFTMMRARGARVTDIVVLVVAADDGVMPQTIEAIDHAKAANVPIVVAINKIDKPEANVAKVRNELANHGIVSEDWGGQNIFVEVSAKQKKGIEHLLEMILLQSEVMELKADYQRHAKGTIIEAKLDKGRGPVATVIVNSGTLKVGDIFLAGTLTGRVRALVDDSGQRVETAGPSSPIEVIGFPDIPQAGDIFIVTDDERKARQIALNRFQKQKASEAVKLRKLTLDDLYEKIKEGEIKELNIIIKADVQGSAEAVKDTLENLSHPQVKVRVIHTGVGGINESDVMLATASNAVIIGFNIRPDAKASSLAEKEGVDIRRYDVIYDAIEDIKKALEGLLEPTITEKILGRAEVRQLFHISKIGTIAGCYVLDGTITRASSGIRVIRDNIAVYDSKIAYLKRFKEDTREVQSGYECGIQVENFNDLKAGDILENYVKEEVAAKFG